jgi:hypothetical protein
MPDARHLFALDNPAVRAMDRATLRAKLPAWVRMIPGLISLLIKLAPIILPLFLANREAYQVGLTRDLPGSPIPGTFDAVTAGAIEAGRRAHAGDFPEGE